MEVRMNDIQQQKRYILYIAYAGAHRVHAYFVSLLELCAISHQAASEDAHKHGKTRQDYEPQLKAPDAPVSSNSLSELAIPCECPVIHRTSRGIINDKR